MTLQRVDLAQDGGLIAGLHDAYVAANAHDPGPLLALPRFRLNFGTDRPGQATEMWVAAEGGTVAGGYSLGLPRMDNTHTATIYPLVVRPERRGRGLGSTLFEHAVGRARAHGRKLLLTETPATGVGARFARAHGMTPSVTEARRTLDLRAADPAALEALTPAVPGYSLQQWAGPAGPELLDDLATLFDGMNDAPRDAGVEASGYDAERVGERERSIAEAGQTCYTTIARHDADGTPAAFTRLVIKADRSDGWANQVDTVVLRPHRGRRLGLLVKLANLLWLREREPHLDRVLTWNATTNVHMLAINETMGFRLLDEWHTWRLEL
ncbi:Acetyltransferase (GNAT) family protein [Nonomuraea coxensis DSM 45129]|uniref:Acetyltransferase (GNAT) family protein n=1 Tax=Nonomuraea coxensis DSM 45129 TaxID=1122611 RepID=A0ABX8TZ39_9ACTN|nr:GNAT family N-acetyltransferase [Nonomuraea coxensis]QYC39794.1 Acetyltransferase (GNAT) family protein [Nonomuraea coxensis DSM 45129]